MKASMTMNRFLRAIEVLPGQATDRRAWKALLGSEWNAAEPFLMSTGRIARDIDCPHPGGENCPRKVVHHHDGTIRAVCGDDHRLCKSLDLLPTDIEILQVDRTRLTAALVVALALKPSPGMAASDRIVPIGRHMLQAGAGLEVFVAFPDPNAPLSAIDVVDLGLGTLPFILLVPQSSGIASDAFPILVARRGRAIQLDQCVAFDRPGRLKQAIPVEVLFRGEVAELATVFANPLRPRAMVLPQDARWSKLTITFVSDEAINVSYSSGSPRRFEPAQLGLMDGRSGRGNQQWALLKAFAITGGELPVHLSKGTSKYQKNKQQLSAVLREAFGIEDEPIPNSRGSYRTAFTIHGSGLTQGRPDQRLTNIRPEPPAKGKK
jgi:hypothetical protein